MQAGVSAFTSGPLVGSSESTGNFFFDATLLPLGFAHSDVPPECHESMQPLCVTGALSANHLQHVRTALQRILYL